jgi:hypothetical protein
MTAPCLPFCSRRKKAVPPGCSRRSRTAKASHWHTQSLVETSLAIVRNPLAKRWGVRLQAVRLERGPTATTSSKPDSGKRWDEPEM